MNEDEEGSDRWGSALHDVRWICGSRIGWGLYMGLSGSGRIELFD